MCVNNLLGITLLAHHMRMVSIASPQFDTKLFPVVIVRDQINFIGGLDTIMIIIHT
jgi:hypothetical protein